MTETEIREQYRGLLNDIDFDKLELGLKTPNIFQILSVARTEIRHSNFLGWLLDPNGNHGLGRLFLVKFLRGVSTSEIATELDEFDIEALNFNNVEIRREWKNIDLLLVFDTLVICIENKIDSKDHSNQLAKYRKIINNNFKNKNKIFVYLTPTGEPPITKSEIDHYALYSYQEIIEQFDRILKIHGKSLNLGVHQYISDYLITTKRELMKNDELNELADKIYKNHRELIDFVFEHKSDAASKLYPVFVKKITDSDWVMGSKHKGYARFLTKKLNDIIPNKGQGWPLKENFLFEIDFFWSKNKAVFKTVVSPGSVELQNIFRKALENVEGYKKPRGNKWLVHFQHSWKFDTEDLIGVSENEIIKILNTEWTEITEIVNKVETELLKYSAELQKHLN
ncbi:hypothetical protein [uncultured Gammaproteobacteria bacterium]|nr:hypothetical protein [uncultured Gammaproteobacteria bacterium]